MEPGLIDIAVPLVPCVGLTVAAIIVLMAVHHPLRIACKETAEFCAAAAHRWRVRGLFQWEDL